jgi:hypothetical protein
MALYIGSQKVKPSGIAKVYVGSTLVYQKSAPSPSLKGQVISFDAFGTGVQKRFRVLSESNGVAKVLSLERYNNQSYIYSLIQTHFDDNYTCGDYNGSNLDTLVNTDYYNSLSQTVKNAIIPESNLIQTASDYVNWDSSGVSANYLNQQKSNGKYYQSRKRDQQTISASKNVHIMDVLELCEYFDTPMVGGVINYANVDALFEITNVSDQEVWPWFMSTRTFGTADDQTPQAYYWSHSNGWIESTNYSYNNSKGKKSLYPVFTVNLSQIEYTVEN